MKIQIVTLLSLVSLLPGCALFDGIKYDRYAGLASVSNSERNFVVDFGQDIKRCAEAPGPAALLNDSKFEASLKGTTAEVTNAEATTSYKNTESVTKLYEVNSILQYAHAMSYRLCESALNGYMSGPEYNKALDKLMTQTENLLRINLEMTEAEAEKIQNQVQIEKVKSKE